MTEQARDVFEAELDGDRLVTEAEEVADRLVEVHDGKFKVQSSKFKVQRSEGDSRRDVLTWVRRKREERFIHAPHAKRHERKTRTRRAFVVVRLSCSSRLRDRRAF